VSAEVVHYHELPGTQGRAQDSFDVGLKDHAVVVAPKDDALRGFEMLLPLLPGPIGNRPRAGAFRRGAPRHPGR
jgi:hypothetical protein